MKSKLKHYAKEIILFFVILTVLTNVISLYKSGELNKAPLKQTYIKLLDKQIYEYPSSKPLMIHFWATWCPVCSLEASNIQAISKDYEVLTVAVKSNKDEIKKYLKDNKLDFKVVNDKNGIMASEFNIQAYPTTFIYDKNKKLIFSEVGYTSLFGLWIRMWWTSLSNRA